jgi:biotin operon repressor
MKNLLKRILLAWKLAKKLEIERDGYWIKTKRGNYYKVYEPIKEIEI